MMKISCAVISKLSNLVNVSAVIADPFNTEWRNKERAFRLQRIQIIYAIVVSICMTPRSANIFELIFVHFRAVPS